MKFLTKKIKDLTDEEKEKISKLTEIIDTLPKHCWIAGGALRALFNNEDWLLKDIDIFTNSPKVIKSCLLELKRQGFRIHNVGPYSFKLVRDSTILDLVGSPYPDVISCLMDFDFTVCCCALDKEQLSYHEDFFDDLENRYLKINNKKHVTFGRVQKYIQKGYSIPNTHILQFEELSKNYNKRLKSRPLSAFSTVGTPNY